MSNLLPAVIQPARCHLERGQLGFAVFRQGMQTFPISLPTLTCSGHSPLAPDGYGTQTCQTHPSLRAFALVPSAGNALFWVFSRYPLFSFRFAELHLESSFLRMAPHSPPAFLTPSSSPSSLCITFHGPVFRTISLAHLLAASFQL